jgi:hypothetical protein
MNNDRKTWIKYLTRIADPVLNHAAARNLKATMPVETGPNTERRDVSYIEAVGRLLAGMAPWLEAGEAEAQPYAAKARLAIESLSDPNSPDYARGTNAQRLVDTAFLAQALLRAPTALWEPLSETSRLQLLNWLRSSRVFKPWTNNWLLFSATVEAALCRFGAADWDCMRIDYALQQHMQWYKGDGIYGDGPRYHADYYNAFVIQPMLVDILDAVREKHNWSELVDVIQNRARRFAAIQERSISPEGTFPPLGRSLAYRCGAMQGLAHAALRRDLPESVSPAQARGALSAVIVRSLDTPGTFDAQGWLRIGFCGAQLGVAENYISTGSLYLCTVAFLPLGLPSTDPFWSDPDEPWTSVKAWSGQDFPIDHAIPN